MGLSRDRLDELGQPRLLVIGDPILDRYTWGDVERVSPEAPVLVLQADYRDVRPGGAASVATLLRGLNAKVTLAGLVGDDMDGRTLRQIIREAGVWDDLLLVDSERPTTVKERFLGRASGRSPHQILRVDHEVRTALSVDQEQRLWDRLEPQLAGFQAILIADYAKGCCTPTLLSRILRDAKQVGIPVLVDPARGADYARYRGATIVKPNRCEAEGASGLAVQSPKDGLAAARRLCAQGFDAVVITLDQDGMVLATAEGTSGHWPTQSRAVVDITGAGDMAIAALGIAAAAGWPLPEAVSLANAAAGLEVERLGIEPISRSELRSRRSDAAPAQSGKILSQDDLICSVLARRSHGARVVFTNGCFDLLHAGHLRCLQEARALGDVLVVAINSDDSVRRLKGAGRPIVSERDRASLLAGLSCVDYVTVFSDSTPRQLLQILQPDVLVKGGTTTEVIGREIVEAYGGRIAITGCVDGRSTTCVVSQIRATAGEILVSTSSCVGERTDQGDLGTPPEIAIEPAT